MDFDIIYTIKLIVFFLILIDIFSSLVSLTEFLPIGKRLFIPRLPLIITLIVILFQTRQRRRTFYCGTCHKNRTADEITGLCSCGTRTKIKYVNLTGKLQYYCKNKSCKKTSVISFNSSTRTRLSRIDPFGPKMQSKIQLVCKTCGAILSGEPVINISSYSGNVELSKGFREDLFYHAFGPAKESGNLYISPANASLLKDIDRHYEHGASRLGLNTVSVESIQLHFKTNVKKINQTLYQFNIAVAQSDRLKLRSAEGIILLLDGAASGVERQSVVDHFLVELQQLNTESAVWSAPVLVGLCCNGVKELESAIDNGDIVSAAGSENICKQFLMDQNNGDVINRLNNGIANIHFFLYRTGTAAEGTKDKVYNVVNPVQALLYHSQSEMQQIWAPVQKGYCPKTTGQK